MPARNKTPKETAESGPGVATVNDEVRRPAGANILLVDDRRENLIALEAALEHLGQNVVTASTGAEALRAALENDFAVILLDVRLPDVDGFDTAKLLRDRERTRHTPIIFLTGIDKDDRQVSRGYSLGAVDYIFKPADPDILRAKVGVFIDLYQKNRQIEELNRSLEKRVRKRTLELERANEELAREVREREQAEEEVRALNAALEERVRARTAELEAANEELRAFSYSVSHDLRAPLRKIAYFSEILLDDFADGLEKDARDYLARIHKCGGQMNSLIDDILKLSRISREQMEFTEVDISELAREVMDELRRSDPNRAVDIRIETNMTASCDRSLLRIALDNLFSNAWKFTTRNPDARIEMGTGGEDSFFVRDNGAGFKMGDVHKLFQPFQRLHPASEYPGTGIGLAIVNRIIRRHGGRIWAEGAQGTGAVFTFTLPRS